MQDNLILDRDTRPSYEQLSIACSILRERVRGLQAERDSLNSECLELRNTWDSHWGAFRHLTERLIRDEFGCTEWTSEQRRAFDELMSNSPVEPVWY